MCNLNSQSVFLDVAVPTPLRKSFQYRLINGCSAAKTGCRVRVPFGKQTLNGIILGYSHKAVTETSKIRPIIEIIDQAPIITEPLMKLCTWASSYYHHPIGDVFAAALPTLVRKGHPAKETIVRLKLTGRGQTAGPETLNKAPRQQALLKQLQQKSSLGNDELKTAGFKMTIINALRDKGLAEWQEQAPAQVELETVIRGYQNITPNQEQQFAIDSINSAGTYLLHGITGSGKTEVYLRKIEDVLNAGKQVLLLVPEIGLTPQTLGRFTNRFAVSIEVIHSGLTDLERLSAWRNAISGTAKIVIGTRSAIFTPLQNLGLLVVDEEHDSSFKQQDGFRYSARDLAVMRGQLEKIPVILGSATPSLESLYNCKLDKYKLITLSERTGGAQNEKYKLINLRHKEVQNGFSDELLAAIRTELDKGNQVLVFINRRGFAPVLYCPDCQWIAICHRCDARLTCHLAQRKLMCHHCGTIKPLTSTCLECQSHQLVPLGLGTQRVEETLSSMFPGYPVHRVDRDSTRRKGTLEKLLTEVKSGQPRLLVGTQILAKGHHFPDVTLVAMLDIDTGFYSADYRSMEKTGQLILQVGGRSGRENKAGNVIIQTQFADQPILRQLIQEGYTSFANTILSDRQLHQLPPFSFHCLIRAESPQKQIAMNFLEDVAREPLPNDSVELLGPVPPTMEKRGGRYRAQLLFSSQSRNMLHRAIAVKILVAEQSKLSKRVRWSVDVDPVDLF